MILKTVYIKAAATVGGLIALAGVAGAGKKW